MGWWWVGAGVCGWRGGGMGGRRGRRCVGEVGWEGWVGLGRVAVARGREQRPFQRRPSTTRAQPGTVTQAAPAARAPVGDRPHPGRCLLVLSGVVRPLHHLLLQQGLLVRGVVERQLPLPPRRFAAHGATEPASVALAVSSRLRQREHHQPW